MKLITIFCYIIYINIDLINGDTKELVEDLFKSLSNIIPCKGGCDSCLSKVILHADEIAQSCYYNVIDHDKEYDCWLYYILPRCGIDYARKYCRSCDEFDQFKNIVHNILEYYKKEDFKCKDFEYDQCKINTSTNKTQSLSINRATLEDVYFPKYSETNQNEPNCTEQCVKCQLKLSHKFDEVNKACTIHYEKDNHESYCWANYINYAKKHCDVCEELYNMEIYIDNYIEYSENAICNGFQSQSCSSNVTKIVNNNKNADSSSKNYIIITITVVSFLIILVLISIILKYKYENSNFNTKMLNILTSKNLYKERDRLSLEDIIGKGNYGCVYKGLYINEEDISMVVAVKTTKIGSKQTLIKPFFNEAIMLNDLKHIRILTPIGICIEPNGYPLIIFPLMAKRDLLSYLRNSHNSLTTKQMIQFAVQIAEGMIFLTNKNFIHRDLAARNILLDNELNIKISDFGLSRDICAKQGYKSKNKTALPLKWMAIESIESGIYNTATDVWSFGVLFWEILSRGLEPYNTIKILKILDHIKDGNRLSQPYNCCDTIYALLLQCWNSVPEQRPSFAYIYDFLTIICD